MTDSEQKNYKWNKCNTKLSKLVRRSDLAVWITMA